VHGSHHRRRAAGLAPPLFVALALALAPAGCGAGSPAGPAGGAGVGGEGGRETGHPAPHWRGAADLDGDGRPDGLAAWFDGERRRGVLQVTRGAARWTSPIYPMWKVRTADLDGDGRAEVVLGVWSWRRRHDEPLPHRSVWVLGWDGRALVELWRGSALARPLEDVDVAAPRTEGGGAVLGAALLVAEERAGGACYRTRYRWTGFGFVGVDREDRPCAPVAGGPRDEEEERP